MSAHIGKTRSQGPAISEAWCEHDVAERRLSNRSGYSPESRTPSHAGAQGRGYFPVDLVIMVYLILASALLIFSPLPVSDRTPLTGVYLLLLVAVSCLRFVPREGYPWLRW
ncbi:MAG: hypothetical protein KAY24_13445, partial [Candidatus Eisenbacteria sp.]|nr:hypothetical protein [Candidatus Eisenbacteria bacterium]